MLFKSLQYICRPACTIQYFEVQVHCIRFLILCNIVSMILYISTICIIMEHSTESSGNS